MLLATPGQTYALLSGGGSSGPSAAVAANSSNKKPTSSLACNSAIAAAVNITTKLQRPILGKLKSCPGGSLKSFSDSSAITSNSRLVSTTTNGSTTTVTTLLAASTSSSLLAPSLMKTLAARCRNSAQESVVSSNKLIAKTSSLNDHRSSLSINANHTHTINTSTTSALSTITISSKTRCSVITLTNTSSNNPSLKTNSNSSSPQTTPSPAKSISVTLLSKLSRKVPSALFLKHFTVPPTALHRSSAERRRATSISSLHEDMCHFKPIQTAPITPNKSSSKSRGVTLRRPVAMRKPNVSSNRSQSKAGRRNTDTVDAKLKIMPSVRLSHHARYSAFVSLRPTYVFDEESDNNQKGKGRKRKAASHAPVERQSKTPKKAAAKKRGRAKAVSKTAKLKKSVGAAAGFQEATSEVAKKTSRKRKSNESSETTTSSDALDNGEAEPKTRGSAKSKRAKQQRANNTGNNNDLDRRNANNTSARHQSKQRATRSSNTTASTATVTSRALKKNAETNGRQTPPLTRSRVKRMPHLPLLDPAHHH